MTSNALTGLTEYRLQLADEVLQDIEQDREAAERLLFKAVRLADVAGDKDVKAWLECELSGYPKDIPASLVAWLNKTGRRSVVPLTTAELLANGVAVMASGHGREVLADGSEVRVDRESLPRIEDHVIPSFDGAWKGNAVFAKVAKRSGPHGTQPKGYDPSAWEKSQNRMATDLIKYQQIAKRVRAELHSYVVGVFHRFAFSEIANSIFDRHKTAVDSLLRVTVPEVVDKVPAIYDRLAAAPDPEAVSQAMVSVRRMIAAFADTVCPPRAQPSIDEASGAAHELTQKEVLNRIDECLKKCGSKTRGERLSKSVRALYDRVSAGIKDDITAGEAQSLFLTTYLTLGEIAEATGLGPS